MASDFSLILYAAEGNSYVFPAHSSCYRTGNRGFTDSGRACKAHNLTRDIGRKIPYGEQFNDSLFNLFKAVMVIVKHLACTLEVKIILGINSPRKLKAGFNIIPFNSRFGGSRRTFFKPCAAFEELCFYFFGCIQL